MLKKYSPWKKEINSYRATLSVSANHIFIPTIHFQSIQNNILLLLVKNTNNGEIFSLEKGD